MQSCYQLYLRALPENVQSRILKFSSPESFMSPGRLSVLALPFWLGEALGIDLEVQREIALANMFGLLHFISQDNLADEESSSEDRLALVISGTLYLQQMFAGYQQFFPPDSPFWPLVDKYWQEWAQSLAWERQTGLRPSFSEADLLQAARKASPLKICTSGLALLAQRQDLVPDLELAVDKMHMVVQMADDLGDLDEDLAGNRYNTILSMMAKKGTLQPFTAPDIDHVGRAIFITSDDGEFFRYMDQVAGEAQALLHRLGLPQWAELVGLTVQKAQMLVDFHLQSVIPDHLNPVFDNVQSEGI